MNIIIKNLFPGNYCAIAIYPFIILKSADLTNDTILMNHEKIHLRQQKELYWLFFFVWYLLEFFIRLTITQNWERAYRSISFEEEAYANEGNLQYLSSKKKYSFLSYL
ncbi:MAG: hypothetical protein COB98_01900 [Flavobacteriaceae bacterium]|nr:MAG: hypothetical protein COB98_01900 [Flavobacteriaceae bacterium]